MGVVAISRNEAIRQNTPLSISVSIDTTPPDTAVAPSISSGARSKMGLKSPTAITSGSTIRSL